ncbi:hypothetical protein QUA20_09220 [Microcoleus sp. Pol7_A1]
MPKGVEGVNWLTTAHLVGDPTEMCGMKLYAVEHHNIVTSRFCRSRI